MTLPHPLHRQALLAAHKSFAIQPPPLHFAITATASRTYTHIPNNATYCDLGKTFCSSFFLTNKSPFLSADVSATATTGKQFCSNTCCVLRRNVPTNIFFLTTSNTLRHLHHPLSQRQHWPQFCSEWCCTLGRTVPTHFFKKKNKQAVHP